MRRSVAPGSSSRRVAKGIRPATDSAAGGVAADGKERLSVPRGGRTLRPRLLGIDRSDQRPAVRVLGLAAIDDLELARMNVDRRMRQRSLDEDRRAPVKQPQALRLAP